MIERWKGKNSKRGFGLSVFCLFFGSLLQRDMCGGKSFLSFTSPQSDTRGRQRLVEGEGGFASVPEEQTCVFF